MLVGVIHIVGALALALVPAGAILLAGIWATDRTGTFWRQVHLLIAGAVGVWLLAAVLLIGVA